MQAFSPIYIDCWPFHHLILQANTSRTDLHTSHIKAAAMKLFAFTALFLGAVMAAPTNDHGSYNACPNGLYSVEQCCATDVLGVANLDCTSREFRNLGATHCWSFK